MKLGVLRSRVDRGVYMENVVDNYKGRYSDTTIGVADQETDG